jgi:hypothetical protein
LPVREPLARRAFDCLGGPLSIIHAKGDSLVVAEIEFAEIPL